MPKWGITYHAEITGYKEIEADTKEQAIEIFEDYGNGGHDLWEDNVGGSEDIIDEIEEINPDKVIEHKEEPTETIEKDSEDHIYEITYTFQRAFTANIKARSAEEIQSWFEQDDEYKYRYTMAEEGKGTPSQFMAIVEIQPEDEDKEYLERSSRTFYNYKTGEAYEGFEKKQPVKYTFDPNPLAVKTYGVNYYYVIVSYVDIKAKNMEEAKKLFSETYDWEPGIEIDESPNFISDIIQIKE